LTFKKQSMITPFLLRCLRPLKLSMETLSFFLSLFTTEVRVRSDDEPGPQPGRLRLKPLEWSRASIMTFLRASATSASMREQRSLTAVGLWRVWLCSCALRWAWLRRSNSFSSSFMESASSKNLSRRTLDDVMALYETYNFFLRHETHRFEEG